MIMTQQIQQRIIETPRLILRGVKPSDVTDLHECFRDAEVMRYWSELPHATPETTQEWIRKMAVSKNNGVTDFVICMKPSAQSSIHVNGVNTDTGEGNEAEREKVIGKVGMWQGNEIGFLLNRAYWGQGLAFEAIPEIIDIGFRLGWGETEGKADADGEEEHESVPEDLIADVDPRNIASLGILKKLGFEVYATKEKTFQIGDEWVDSVFLNLRRKTWIRMRLETMQRMGRTS